jgi:hypothetical protein
MKRSLALFFILIFVGSCQKPKQASIVGVWREISVYSKDNTGNYYWSAAPGFPYFLTLRADGTYSGWQCTPTGSGAYQYDHANRRITLQATPPGVTETISVSVLDDDYLILDYGLTSMGEFKVKFIRSQY